MFVDTHYKDAENFINHVLNTLPKHPTEKDLRRVIDQLDYSKNLWQTQIFNDLSKLGKPSKVEFASTYSKKQVSTYSKKQLTELTEKLYLEKCLYQLKYLVHLNIGLLDVQIRGRRDA